MISSANGGDVTEIEEAKRLFEPWDWALLVGRHPNMIQHSCYAEFTGAMWHTIITQQPLLADSCNWALLDLAHREHLVELHPTLMVYHLLYI